MYRAVNKDKPTLTFLNSWYSGDAVHNLSPWASQHGAEFKVDPTANSTLIDNIKLTSLLFLIITDYKLLIIKKKGLITGILKKKSHFWTVHIDSLCVLPIILILKLILLFILYITIIYELTVGLHQILSKANHIIAG